MHSIDIGNAIVADMGVVLRHTYQEMWYGIRHGFLWSMFGLIARLLAGDAVP